MGVRAPAARPRPRGMKLRTRITLAATVAVALGIGAGVSFAYLAVRAEMLGAVDRQLDRQAVAAGRFSHPDAAQKALLLAAKDGDGTGTFIVPRKRFGDSVAYVQVVRADGTTSRPVDQTVRLPVEGADLAVAAGRSPALHRTIGFQGTAIRLETAPAGSGEAVQVALPLTAVYGQLDQLGLELLAAGLAGILLSAGLGWWVTRTALRPVAQLTEAAERIAAAPKELARRIEPAGGGRDELGRLAVSFNAMLCAVEDATARQRQMVADASHELRTPLTSLRTNVEVLRKIEMLEPEDRERLISSVLAGIDDLTGLVADTVELARGEEPAAALERLRWDELLARAADRARAHWPQVEFRTTARPCTVSGVPDRVQRAVGNLLDNAAKFSGGRGLVEVGLDGGTLTVRDHGPGIAEVDLPHVFDRFYRAPGMRDRPGSGLGLAIVAQVAESHGGAVGVANHPEGGAVFSLTLPLLGGAP